CTDMIVRIANADVSPDITLDGAAWQGQLMPAAATAEGEWVALRLPLSFMAQAHTLRITGASVSPVVIDSITVLDRSAQNVIPLVVALGIAGVVLLHAIIAGLRARWQT
ncbi:MAG: hypothetical protein KC547_15210, partial [Anaerolineae bacterium]|nr:hypothetical protein [Anaerolineae bacterium]